MVFIKYIFNKCQGDPILKLACTFLAGAIQEPHQTLAQVTSVVVVAQRRMILDASTF